MDPLEVPPSDANQHSFHKDELISENMDDFDTGLNGILKLDKLLEGNEDSTKFLQDSDVNMNTHKHHFEETAHSVPRLTVSHMDRVIENSTSIPINGFENRNFGNIVGYNGDNGYIDAPPIVDRTSQYHQDSLPFENNLLNEISWDFEPNNNRNTANSINGYAESLTLGSDSRTSAEYFSRASNEFFARSSNELFSRDSMELFDSSSNVASLEEVEPRRSKFANSISNSLSSIFKNDNKPSKFNLRGINPLSTHRDPGSLAQQLPNNLVDNVENLSIDREDSTNQDGVPASGKCMKNLHVRSCDCVSKKKRSTTNSILNSLTHAGLGFNLNRGEKKSLQETVIKEEEEEPKLEVPKNDSVVDFDEDLEMAISLASRNSSVYNFNSPRASTDTHYTDAFQNPTPNEIDSIIEDGAEAQDSNNLSKIKEEKQSPDYAALFSDVGVPKKRSKTLSFKKISLASQPKEPDSDKPNSITDMDSIPESDDLKTEKIKEYPSLSEDGSIQIIPMKESTRGRKPSLEYDASKTFVCNICSRRFRRQEHLKRHFRSIHTNQKPFDCPFCNKKFSRSDNLTQHIKTHDKE